MRLSEFDYDLPDELIAQHPPAERDGGRLMRLDRASGAVSHHMIRDLPALLPKRSLLVLNDTRVVPARLAARFAAKEAAAKALGTGIGDVSWVDIEVASDARGRPTLNLYKAAARLADDLGLQDWQVSLSHTDDLAIAFVAAIGATPVAGDE